ncbi:hypothetical protein [Spirosoma sordidisoli]|uniref:Uncharacterized protein n=1 Tax=Spirosoma sordidisoli TaxID=2502893 RepID=A0A4Q2UC46_9BACT|nr:hypothetical protein [Spirosoma sordidisoli]RYC66673.1 hypothetical protein EQG79_27935 [Spirosoma sordidisoli]
MITYEIGQPYPHKGYHPKKGEIKAVMDHSFFHIVYYCTQPEADGPNWQKGPLSYGLHVSEDIPCFLVHLTGIGLAFEVTLNVHTLNIDLVDSWLNSDRTLVPMLLMDAHTNIIRAIRMLSIQPTMAASLRDCLERQDARYVDALAVDRATDDLLNSLNTRQLLQLTIMYRAS